MMTQGFKFKMTRRLSRNWKLIGAVLAIALVLGPPAAHAQTFESGSDGSDGALNLTTPGTIDFDPGALGLDADGDHIFHFTTINVATDVIVRLSARQINGPVFWLASGDVQIDGTIDIRGEPGQDGQEAVSEFRRAVPGAGGFEGGLGAMNTELPTPGLGPGGSSSVGSHVSGALPYGNSFLVPLVGGSGGGGGFTSSGLGVGGGGGTGGGAILIASSASIGINGAILADGGRGGSGLSPGGSGRPGSGGAIHLLAPTISVAGFLVARGFGASNGRIRIEAFQRTIQFVNVVPAPVHATPFALFLPTTLPSALRVVSVAGIPVPFNPTGSFTMPDATINNRSPVDVVVEAHNIPVGTVVQLHLLSESGENQIVNSTPLAGTDALSTATATATFPSGFSRGFVRATFGPPSP